MEKGKKIVAFVQSLGGGGAQGVLVTVMNHYASLGYKVTVVVESLENDINSKKLNKDIHIVSFDVYSTKAALKKTVNYIKLNNIDYAFAFSPEIAVNLYIARCLLKKEFFIIGRCINTLSYEYKYASSFFRKYVSKNLVKMIYRKINKVIVQAENMARDLVENFGVPEKKIYIINNPLSEKYETIVTENIQYEKENYILYVGRLEQQKGLHMLLKAFSMISNKSVELRLIGNGSMKKELIEDINHLGIDRRVHFIDFTTDIEKHYKKAKVTVLSSYYEGFPNVLLESIACGTPVVSFDLPSGPSDIIIDGINGHLAKYLDIQSLSQSINKALNRVWDEKAIKETSCKFLRSNILKEYDKILQF